MNEKIDSQSVSSVKLAYRYYGSEGKTPLVILHGLVGSSRNWNSVAKLLATHFDVFALDVRNHGDSSFDDSHAYDDLVNDVLNWLDEHQMGRVVLLGHSMGGKIAMRLACQYPDRLWGLIVVDVAPRDYESRWQKEFQAMLSLDVSKMRERREAEEALERAGVDDWAFRKFLVSNLQRLSEGGFRWQINLPVLSDHLDRIFKNCIDEEDHFAGPALVVRGELSKFIVGEDLSRFVHHFPGCRIATINGAGHNVHADQRDTFVETLRRWSEDKKLN